ncbi:MAG: hypothetical protein QOE77_3323 [Blastocatellia bacterium]|jgi:hypothetical protein|nr:hypothetical protein [Blastocatellia bacterium]
MPTQESTAAKPMNVRCSEGFIPPSGLVRRIRSALRWIDPADLEGIDFVFLFDDVPPVTPGKNREAEEAIRDGLLLFAAYKARNERWPAHIMLITRTLYKPVPRFLQHSPALTLWIAENIAHEVGHHVIAERRFTFRPKTDGSGTETEEEFADHYADSIISKMKSSPVYKFGSMLLKVAAQLNYYKGARSWKKGAYQTAAGYFYLATQLQQNHRKASYWYWRATAKASEQSAAHSPTITKEVAAV